MTKYNCKYCGFSMNHKPIEKRCPYCNKPGAMQEEENAEEIVIEA